MNRTYASTGEFPTWEIYGVGDQWTGSRWHEMFNGTAWGRVWALGLCHGHWEHGDRIVVWTHHLPTMVNERIETSTDLGDILLIAAFSLAAAIKTDTSSFSVREFSETAQTAASWPILKLSVNGRRVPFRYSTISGQEVAVSEPFDDVVIAVTTRGTLLADQELATIDPTRYGLDPTRLLPQFPPDEPENADDD